MGSCCDLHGYWAGLGYYIQVEVDCYVEGRCWDIVVG